MTPTEQNFYNILSGALWDKPLFLDNPDYKEILDISISHHLMPLVFEKLCEDSNFKATQLYSKAKMNVMLKVMGQAQRTQIFLELYKKLNEQGIYPIVMKGIICRMLYGKYADHRPSSDEDILVLPEDFHKTCEFFKSEGYDSNMNPDEVDLNNLQAISFFNNNGGHFEVHVNPIGKGNELSSLMDSYFHDVFKDSIEFEINGIKIESMSHTNHFLFLIFHAFRHFMYSGFGVRQVIDMLLYEQKHEDEIDWKYIKSALKKTSSDSFFADLVSIGNTYLGFNLPIHGKVRCPEELLSDLMSNGIFGNDSNAKIMAGTMTSMAVKNSEKDSNKSGAILKTIFPSRQYMLMYDSELNDKPWRLLIAWGKRWIRFVKRNQSNGGNLAQESMDIGNRRISLLKKYGIVK